MTSEVERYRSMPMQGKWEYAARLAAADDLLPRAFRGPVWNEARQMFEQKIVPGKVFLAIEYGAMLGLPALAAINGIHVIEGKPSLSAATMSGLIRAAGHKLRIVKTGSIAGGDFSVTVTLIRSDDPDEPISTTWTPQRALVAELIDGYAQQGNAGFVVRAKKDNWRKQPETMLTWRAMSECCRIGADDVFMGAAYTPDELGEIEVDDNVADLEQQQLDALAGAQTASEAEKMFRSWSNEGLVSPKVSAAAMGRVAFLTAYEAARAAEAKAAAPQDDAGPGEEIAEPVDENPSEPADDAQGQQEPEFEPEEDEDVRTARRIMPEADFEAWLAARPSRSDS